MPIVLNGSTGITTEGINVDTIVDTAGIGSPSVPNGFEQMFVLPVGTLMWFTGNTAPGGYLVADGTLHSRAAYPDLWSWIVTSGNLAVSDAAWDEGKYSPGDGSTTFRVPKVDDRFIRGKSATRAVGLVEEDQNKTHEHSVKLKDSGYAASTFVASGATRMEVTLTTTDNGFSTFAVGGDETRPKALTMLPCIKAYDVISDPNVLNAVAVVNDIARMMPRDENINLGVSVPASGTAVDFVGIPEGVKRITVMFDGVSTNGTSPVQIQIGNNSIDTFGYKGSVVAIITTVVPEINTNGNRVTTTISALAVFNGGCSIDNIGYNTYIFMSNVGFSHGAAAHIGGGSKSLSGPLDRIRITTVNGTDQFDAGTINISWEF